MPNRIIWDIFSTHIVVYINVMGVLTKNMDGYMYIFHVHIDVITFDALCKIC